MKFLQRLIRLERQVASLQKQLASSKGKKTEKTWRDYIGMFKDDPYFERAMKAGAKWRHSFRPKPLGQER